MAKLTLKSVNNGTIIDGNEEVFVADGSTMVGGDEKAPWDDDYVLDEDTGVLEPKGRGPTDAKHTWYDKQDKDLLEPTSEIIKKEQRKMEVKQEQTDVVATIDAQITDALKAGNLTLAKELKEFRADIVNQNAKGQTPKWMQPKTQKELENEAAALHDTILSYKKDEKYKTSCKDVLEAQMELLDNTFATLDEGHKVLIRIIGDLQFRLASGFIGYWETQDRLQQRNLSAESRRSTRDYHNKCASNLTYGIHSWEAAMELMESRGLNQDDLESWYDVLARQDEYRVRRAQQSANQQKVVAGSADDAINNGMGMVRPLAA